MHFFIIKCTTKVSNFLLLQTESETSCEEAARLTAEGADDDDEAYDYQELPPPPDGGYGWVVVFASFMCNLVVDGIAYTFGIFLSELVTFFGEGKGTVAWVGSLLSGVYLAAGKLSYFSYFNNYHKMLYDALLLNNDIIA